MDEPIVHTLGDFGRHAVEEVIYGFQLQNPGYFDIKNIVLLGLKDNPFDGSALIDPYKHLARFKETCTFSNPTGVS